MASQGNCYRCGTPTTSYTSSAAFPLGNYWCGCAKSPTMNPCLGCAIDTDCVATSAITLPVGIFSAGCPMCPSCAMFLGSRATLSPAAVARKQATAITTAPGAGLVIPGAPASSMKPPTQCTFCLGNTLWMAIAPGVWDCSCGKTRYSALGANVAGLPKIGTASPMCTCPLGTPCICPPKSLCGPCGYTNGSHSNTCPNRICGACGNFGNTHSSSCPNRPPSTSPVACSYPGPACGCSACTGLTALIKKQFAAAMSNINSSYRMPVYKEEIVGVTLTIKDKKCECGSGSDGGNLHYDWCQCSPNYRAK